jgi:hypothetical protein
MQEALLAGDVDEVGKRITGTGLAWILAPRWGGHAGNDGGEEGHATADRRVEPRVADPVLFVAGREEGRAAGELLG